MSIVSLVDETLLQIYDELVISIAGNSITAGETQSSHELGVDMYLKIRKYLLTDRINVDVGNEFKRRSTIFSPKIILPTAMSNEAKSALLDLYPIAQDDKIPKSRKELEALWGKFKAIQTLCRNKAGAKYNSIYGKIKSGAYTDEEAIEAAWEHCRKAQILENMKKSKSSYLNIQKDNLKEAFDKDAALSQWETKNSATYDFKLQNWKADAIPIGFVSFVLLGRPGINLNVFKISGSGETEASGIGKKSRRQIREEARADYNGTDGTWKSSSAQDVGKQRMESQAQVVSLKVKELNFANEQAKAQRLKDALDILKHRHDPISQRARQQIEDKLISEALSLLNEGDETEFHTLAPKIHSTDRQSYSSSSMTSSSQPQHILDFEDDGSDRHSNQNDESSDDDTTSGSKKRAYSIV